MAEVESFTLDHTKVKAPYVRLIAEEVGTKGDVIANYDFYNQMRKKCQQQRFIH